ncbi:MAG: ribosome small subunit-dependent GTPase A [Xanthomonadales bacterium]|nr:ribosome small subunit-dependent GTPase A [Xanthomonadales bacterium]
MHITPEHLARLRGMGWREDAPAASAYAEATEGRLARVIEQHRSGYVVDDGEREFPAQAPAPWTRKGFAPEQRAAVGDWVRLKQDEDLILDWLPRFGVLKRAAAGEHYKQQLIAANIDRVLVVCGLDGDFNPRRLERYLVLVRGSGAEAVFVLTKADQLDDEDVEMAMDVLQPLEEAGARLIALNARSLDSVRVLHPLLGPGITAVLVGSSGAGKSTLTNALLGIERQKTNAVRANDSRGRHTTTHRALLRLPSGGCLIDTPGMRELKLTGEETLDRSGFDRIEALAAECRFRDCQHEREPGCAVQAALEAEEIDPGALTNYRKLQGELEQARQVLKQRERQGPRGPRRR